jgi:solute carrier family 25 (mitochondrial adenine nucleotide translocator), member 4/5/6/31
LQTQSVNAQIKSNSTPYKGAIDCVRRVYTEQGLWSFWRGNVANVTRYFPSQAINFAMKDQYKQVFSVDAASNPVLAHMANLASGGMAGATSLTFIYPLDVARTRLAADVGDNKIIQRKFSSTLGCLSEVYKAVRS